MICLGWRIEFNGRNGLANSPKEPPKKRVWSLFENFKPKPFKKYIYMFDSGLLGGVK
jgi:hypothetical protein